MTHPPPWSPDWKGPPEPLLQPYTPPPQQWKPGQSGCPTGRPKGIVDKRMRITQMLGDAAEDVVRRAVEMAKAGDPVALIPVLSRVAPALKPTDQPVEFELDERASLADQARSILAAVKQGQLTPDQGKQLMDLVSQASQVITGEEALAQLAQLRAEVAQLQSGGVSSARGGVLAAEMDNEGNLK